MLPVISHTSTVADLFSSRTFIAASVQRDYQWNTPECETLLSDLVRAWSSHLPAAEADLSDLAQDESIDADLGLLPSASVQPPLPDYYLGAVVTRLTADGATEIYDGLQRITTLTILMAVLRDAVTDEDLKQSIDNLINTAPGKPRVMLHARDATLFKEIQKWGEAGKIRRSAATSDFQSRVREAARTFRTAAQGWSPEEQASFIDFLLRRVAIVIVQASAGRLARQIFVTTNLRGLPLNQADLFKGQVLDLAPDESTAGDMENSWARVQHAVGDDLVPFLTTIDFITRRQEQSADCLQELIDHLADKVGPSKIKDWLKRLSVFATAWEHLEQKLSSPPSNPHHANIWRLGLFKWQQWKPLALLWHANYLLKSAKGITAASEAANERRFALLHRRCMAFTLAGLNQTQRSMLFGQAIRQTIKSQNSLKGALSITANIKTRMTEKLSLPFVDEDRRIVLFRWLESLCWDLPPTYIAQGSLEHVLPQRPDSGSQWLVDFPDEDERYDLCHSIGNFALLDAETNTQLGNADFTSKRNLIATRTDVYRTLRGLEAMKTWTESDIHHRCAALTNWVLLSLHDDAISKNGSHRGQQHPSSPSNRIPVNHRAAPA